MLSITNLSNARNFLNLTIVFMQGITSAIPFALVTGTLQSWFIAEGMPLQSIGWLALLAQAYLFKFFWANYCDSYCIYGSKLRKSWITCSQLLLICLFFVLSNLNPLANSRMLVVLAFLAAIVSATQDINIDAYRSDLVECNNNNEKWFSLSYIVGFRLGYLIAGAGSLLLAQWLNWNIAYQVMTAIFATCSLFSFFMHEEPASKNPIRSKLLRINSIKYLWAKNKSGLIFTFIFLFEFGDSMITSVYPAYLYQVQQFDFVAIALLLKTTNLIGLFVSPIVAVVLLRFVSFFKALAFGLMFESSCIAFLSLTSTTPHSLFWIQLSFGLCEGMLGAMIIILYTHFATGKTKAFNYSLIAACGGIKTIITPSLAILIVHLFSWDLLFYSSALLTLPSAILALYLNRNRQTMQLIHYPSSKKYALP